MATQTELEYGCSCCVYVERHLGNRAECPTWDTASGPRTSYCEANEAGRLTLECPTWDTASGPRTSNCEANEAGRLTLV
jgi:hypothetical protein